MTATKSNRTTRLFSDHVVLGGTSDTLQVASALVTIEDRLIVAAEPLSRASLGSSPETDPTSGALVDLGSKLVAPAFINGHTHLALCALRGIETAIADRLNVVEELYYKLERFLVPGDVRAFARMGAWESLLNGTGTVWDHYYHARHVAEALLDVGLTGVVAPTLQDVNGPGVPYLEPQIEATAELAGDERLAEAGIVAAAGPHATDTVSSDVWARVRELSDDFDLVIHAHVAQSVEEYQRSVEWHGCSPIERLSREGTLDAGRGFLLVHGLFVTENDLDLLDAERHVLGHCPFSQTQFDFPTPLAPWLSRDVRVSVGTDAGACNDSMNVQKEFRAMAGAGVFSTTHGAPWRAFHRSGQVAEAEAVHLQRNASVAATQPLREAPFLMSTVWNVPGDLHAGLRVGQITSGYRANLVVIDLEHPACWPANDPLRTLAMTDVAAALHGVMINGRWVGTPGDHHRSILRSEAFRESQSEAEARLTDLLRRAGIELS